MRDAVDTDYKLNTIVSQVVLGACKNYKIIEVKERHIASPCGKCLACRIRRRSIWSIRLLHEITRHEEASFVTLTYNDENLPVRGNDARGILVKSDLQKFFKRYRKKVKDKKVKFYACGEYGDIGNRPHFHSIIFNSRLSKEDVEELWKLGRVDVGSATEQSIRYVSGYVSKKLGLSDYNDNTRPAIFQMSSQGIGYEWAKENWLEILYNGFLSYRGKKLPVPRAYIDLLNSLYPEEITGFRADRIHAADIHLTDLILEMLPEYGGKKYGELTQEEKDNFMVQLAKRGKAVDDDLRSKQYFDEKKHEEKRL